MQGKEAEGYIMGIFSTRWDDESEAKALDATADLHDQKKLIKAALYSRHESVREASAQKLDGRSLNEAASGTRDEKIYRYLVGRMDRSQLAEAMNSTEDLAKKEEILHNAQDNEFVKRFALDEKNDMSLRITAAGFLSEESDLTEIVEAGPAVPEDVKLAALDRLENEEILIDLASRYYVVFSFIGRRAFSKAGSSKEGLMRLIFSDKTVYPPVRSEALEMLYKYRYRLNREEARSLVPFLEDYRFYVMMLFSECEDEELRHKALEKTRYIENHRTEGPLEDMRYICSGTGEIYTWYKGEETVINLDGSGKKEIKIFNGAEVEHDPGVILDAKPYTQAEQMEYQQYLQACATDNI